MNMSRIDVAPDPRAEALLRVVKPAGDAALDRFLRATVKIKADGSKVTDADLAANDALVSALEREFPGELVVSEEGSDHEVPTSGAVWVVDPLDGTGAFTEGLAYWGPTLCRLVDGRLDIGAFWVPRLNELWFAADGGGAWRGASRLRPLEPEIDRNAILFVPSFSHHVGRIGWPGRTRSLGSTAAHFAHVASGGAAAVAVGAWSLWYLGCGVLLVREAGRVVVALSGAEFDPMMAPNTPLIAAARAAVPMVTAALRPLVPGS